MQSAADAALDAYQDRFDMATALATVEAHGIAGKPRIARVRYTHDAMIDLIIENPAVSQNKLAEIFGFSVGWVSIVINSDAFQAKLAQRRDELVNPALRISIQERFRAVTTRSLEVLAEKLNDPKCSDALALKAAEIGAKALGIGGNAPPPAAPSGDHLSSLADRLLALNSRARNSNVIQDVEAFEIRTNAEDAARAAQPTVVEGWVDPASVDSAPDA